MAAHEHFHWNDFLARTTVGTKDFYARAIGCAYRPTVMADGATYGVATMDGGPVAGIFPINRQRVGAAPCYPGQRPS